MTRRKGGRRRKSKSKMRKTLAMKGKISLTRYFAEFSEGDNVQLLCESAVHSGLYPADFHGMSGIVSGRSGRCCLVRIKDGGKEKTLIVHPVHLKKLS